jgi:sodium transport system permease protein
VPALAQNVLMTRVLRGEGVGLEQAIASVVVCLALTVAGVWFVARRLHTAAVR